MTAIPPDPLSSGDRVPPHDRSAERQTLGACLRLNAAIGDVLQFVRAEDFYADAHQKIFAAIVHLYDAGKPADTVTVAELLIQRHQIDDIGGPAGLWALWDETPTAANAEWYARIVRDKAVLRRLEHHANQTLTEVRDKSGPAETVLESAEKRLFEVAQFGVGNTTHELADVLRETTARIDDRLSGQAAAGISTGYLDLDDKTGGLHDSEFIIVAARPSVGKTVFGLNLARNAIRDGHAVFFVSLEQSRCELVERMLCCEGYVDSHRMRKGSINTEDSGRLNEALGRLLPLQMHIDDTPGQTMLRIAANARRLKLRKGIRLVVIDYLQLITPEDRRAVRQEQVASISRRLKLLARELQIPVVVMAQLNRGVEDRQNQRPRLSDLRESGSQEQDADEVLLLHRPGMQDGKDETSGSPVDVMEVVIGKQRNGPIGDLKLSYRKAFYRLENYAVGVGYV